MQEFVEISHDKFNTVDIGHVMKYVDTDGKELIGGVILDKDSTANGREYFVIKYKKRQGDFVLYYDKIQTLYVKKSYTDLRLDTIKTSILKMYKFLLKKYGPEFSELMNS